MSTRSNIRHNFFYRFLILKQQIKSKSEFLHSYFLNMHHIKDVIKIMLGLPKKSQEIRSRELKFRRKYIGRKKLAKREEETLGTVKSSLRRFLWTFLLCICILNIARPFFIFNCINTLWSRAFFNIR